MSQARQLVVLSILMAVVAACGGGPYRQVQAARQEGYVKLVGGTAVQTVYIDGVAKGAASEFNGSPGILAVRPGMRSIEVREGDRVVLQERVYIGVGVTKALDVP